MKKKILLIFGTRPEAIKMAPLVKEFQKYQEVFEYESLCNSATQRNVRSSIRFF